MEVKIMNRIYLQLFAEEGEPKNGDGQNQAEPGNALRAPVSC